jgi:hypothetical protein
MNGSQVMARIIQPTLARSGNGLLVGPDMSLAPPTGSASSAALYFSDGLGGPERAQALACPSAMMSS